MRFLRIPLKRAKSLLNSGQIEVLKKHLKCEIRINYDGEVEINGGDPLEEMRAYNIIRAYGRGFSFNRSLCLLEDDKMLAVINISDYAKNKARYIELKGRVIGRRGRTKAFIEEKTNTVISAYGKTISIIGGYEGIYNACKAVEMLLSGRKHGSISKFLKSR